jgi:hypothetical protein
MILRPGGHARLSRKIAYETKMVTVLTTASGLAQQLVWAVDIIGAPSALILGLLTRAGGRCGMPPDG